MRIQSCKSKGMQNRVLQDEVEFSGRNVNQTIRIAGINMHRMDLLHVTDSGIITWYWRLPRKYSFVPPFLHATPISLSDFIYKRAWRHWSLESCSAHSWHMHRISTPMTPYWAYSLPCPFVPFLDRRLVYSVYLIVSMPTSEAFCPMLLEFNA